LASRIARRFQVSRFQVSSFKGFQVSKGFRFQGFRFQVGFAHSQEVSGWLRASQRLLVKKGFMFS